MSQPFGTLPSGFKRELLRNAYVLTRERFWLIALYLSIATLPEAFNLVVSVMAVAVETVLKGVQPEGDYKMLEGVANLLSFVVMVAGLPLMPGFYRALLRMIRKEETTVGDLFAEYRRFWDYLFSGVLSFLGISVGFLALVVPGVLVFLGWFFYVFAIVDEGAGPVAALGRSWELTRGVRWQLFLFCVLLLALNVLGLLACVVGLFLTVPMSYVAVALFYEKLKIRDALLVPHLEPDSR